MTIIANQNGVAAGTITVPSGIPAGTVEVAIVGSQGSRGTATYTANGEVEVQQRRLVTTTYCRFDPLAQTFTLDSGRHVGGVDLWFKAKGTSRVIVQIRETTVGYPNRNVIAHASISASNINVDGSHTRVTFRPIWLEANVEYAVVILTDDAITSVAVCEIGQYDSVHQGYATKQAYQAGVLLSSSNASTWTAHQTMDLTFRLLACRFSESNLDIPLGTVVANNHTDIMALAVVERVSAGTDLEFILTDSGGNEHTISEDAAVALRTELSGNVSVKARLKGNSTQSPVLYQGVQILLGKQRVSGDYVTRAIPAGANSTVNVSFECYTPGTSDVKVYYQQPDTTWSLIPLTSGSSIGEGLEEHKHTLTPYNQSTVRIKLVLEGSVLYRPYVKNLCVVTK